MMRDLIERYERHLTSPDPTARAVAARQLARRHRSAMPPDRSRVDPVGGKLVVLVESAVGPLHHQSGGDLQGPCPWHGSQSGRCLVVFADGEAWWCRSCRRGGDVVAWVAAFEGVPIAEARRRLGLPRRAPAQRRRRRPTLAVTVGEETGP
jgi:hypothetical protein